MAADRARRAGRRRRMAAAGLVRVAPVNDERNGLLSEPLCEQYMTWFPALLAVRRVIEPLREQHRIDPTDRWADINNGPGRAGPNPARAECRDDLLPRRRDRRAQP